MSRVWPLLVLSLALFAAPCSAQDSVDYDAVLAALLPPCQCKERWQLTAFGRPMIGCGEVSSNRTWCVVEPKEDCAYNNDLYFNVSWSYCDVKTNTCPAFPGTDSTDREPSLDGKCEDLSPCNVDSNCVSGMCLQDNPELFTANSSFADLSFSCQSCPDGSPMPCGDGAACTLHAHCEGGMCWDSQCASCSDGSPAPCPVNDRCGSHLHCETNLCYGTRLAGFKCAGCSDGSQPPCADGSDCFDNSMCAGGICSQSNNTCMSCGDGSAAPCDVGDTCFDYKQCKSQVCMEISPQANMGKCERQFCDCKETWSVEGAYPFSPNGTHNGCLMPQDNLSGRSSWCQAETNETCYANSDQGVEWVPCLFTGNLPDDFYTYDYTYYGYEYYDYEVQTCDSGAHSDCDDGYCDVYNQCWSCSYLDTEYGCDAFGEDCCSEDFLAVCPASPFDCEGRDTASAAVATRQPTATPPTSQPTWKPTMLPTNLPTKFPTYNPTPAVSACEDLMVNGEPWHDDGGAKYNCADHYSKPGKCASDGHKYSWNGLVANEACCECKELILEQITSANTDCTDTMIDGEPWHDDGGTKYNCADHYSKPGKCASDGNKYEWNGLVANEACCACKQPEEDKTSTSTGSCTPDLEWKHPKYSDMCVDYFPGGASHKYWCEDMPKEACCTCPEEESAATAVCKDITSGGAPWHDNGGIKYDCEWYGAEDKGRCEKHGTSYPNDGLVANEACCACGGGEENTGATGSLAAYKHTKALPGGYTLYWTPDVFGKKLKMAILAKEGVTGWVGVGFSKTGQMAGADAVVGWEEDGSIPASIKDYYIANQSPSGITEQNRQGISNAATFTENGRLGLRFERPYTPNQGGSLIIEDDFTNMIYASGPLSIKCTPFCNHPSDQRFVTKVVLAASITSGLSLDDINLSQKGEPCHGPLALKCVQGLYCFHAAAVDKFGYNALKEGECVDASDLGQEDDESQGVQRVFQNDGGYENKKLLKGGFVMLWTVNEKSGSDDTISVALVSTAPNKQGWIGLGFSPTGGMAGSDSVIGWSSGSNTFVGDFFLKEQIADGVKVADKQELKDMRVIKANGQTAIAFERPLMPKDSSYIIPGTTPIIYGSGTLPASSTTPLAYHKFREMEEVALLSRPGVQVSELNAAKKGELCGNDYPACKKTLTCSSFPEGSSPVSGGFKPFGVCLADKDESSTFDFGGYTAQTVIQEGEFDHVMRLEKAPRPVYLHWSVINNGQDIRIAAVSGYKASNYFAFGFSSSGGMLGSHVVVGWDGGEDKQHVDTYYLAGKLPWDIEKSNTLEATDLEVRRVDAELALIFTRPLETAGAGSIVEDVLNKLVYAVGPMPLTGEDFGYHKFRFMKSAKIL